ncbi:MAG: hypothetical protein DLM73_05680, partial [Chthoniobacterales bacterium]
AQSYGQRSVCVILSGSDSDGVIGLKHVRAHGGVTIAQDPNEAQHGSMPMTAISTGMVDWVLPVAQMPGKLMEFVRNENAMRLPPEITDAETPDAKVREAPGGETVSDETHDAQDEEALAEVLAHLRAHTAHDFAHYKRATVLRRIARRMQVNSINSIPKYLEFLRKHSAEARALLQDLLIGVTHFFRDPEAFAALQSHIPQLFGGKGPEDAVRVWVAGCATGEEAYSIAMLLVEHAESLPSPPKIQVLASDIDEQAIQQARDGLYPGTIEADVSLERLRQFFVKDHGRYRVRKELRETVLFAAHDVLKDAPFSRVDLISCRNLLIYLNAKAQDQVFDIFHFALRPGGLLFIGAAEGGQAAQTLFSPLDTKHRIYIRRSVPRPTWKIPTLPLRTADPAKRVHAEPRPRQLPALSGTGAASAGGDTPKISFDRQERRAVLFGELHLKLLEEYGPSSAVVNEAHDLVHLSENGGRYLQFVAGEPSANIVAIVRPELRGELRAALFRAGQTSESVTGSAVALEIEGERKVVTVEVRPVRGKDSAQGYFLVLFRESEADARQAQRPAVQPDAASVTAELENEIQFLKQQLNSTVEQYEATSEELKASNEELQAMNEEMRSATEELETSKEELQSVNEELITVNNELKSNVEELSRANSDLHSLMASTDIGTIFLDRQLRIARFTPSAQKIFNIIPSDLGRPLSDITNRLRYPDLLKDAQTVLDSLAGIENEVRLETDRCFLSRIAPYRGGEDRIAGVVVTFVDITRRKHTEEALRSSEEHFRVALEAAEMAAWDYDVRAHKVIWNEQHFRLLGLEPDGTEKTPAEFLSFVHPDDLEMVRERLRVAVEESGTYRAEFRIIRKDDGATHWMSGFGKALTWHEGKAARMTGVMFDISERRRAEEALRESENRLRILADAVPQIIWTNNADGTANYFNKRWFDFSGLTYEQSAGPGWQAIVHPADAPASRDKWQQALAVGEVFDAEYRLQRKDGEYRWFIGRNVPLRDAEGGVTSWFGTATDIQDLKQAETALRESEERFRQFAENSADVFWILDAKTRRLEYLNPAYERIWGESRETVQRDVDRSLQLVHPEDRDRVQRSMPKLVAGNTQTVEYRIIRASDKAVRWIRDTGFAIPNDKGEITRVAGVAQDITRDKERTAALGVTKERFELLVEGAREYAMFLLDTANEITYWSQGAERVFGWSAEEAVGQSGELIFTPEDRTREAEEKEIEIALHDGTAPDQRWHMRKDGSRIWIDGVMRRLDDEKTGALRGFAKIARDATQQREAEEQLRHAHEQLERRVQERTAELERTNAKLRQAMDQRQMLEKQILRITEQERARISQDLHDSLCQELTATAFLLKSRSKAIATQNKAAADSLAEAAETVNGNAGLARDLARGLHPLELGSAGLPSALRELCARTNDHVSCRCDCPRSLRLDQTMAVNLYRIAQEAVTNSMKHAKANEIAIILERTNGEIVLTISDDGQGKRRRGHGLGTLIMQYRARAIGGTLRVESTRNRGTSVTCRVPLHR